MRRVPDGVRAVLFDAVGTLIHPQPSAGAAYFEIGRRFGSRLAEGEVKHRFGAAFARQERLDAEQGHRTDEEREFSRWRAIVAEVLDDVADAEGCFRALYAHFAESSAWRAEPGAGDVLRRLIGAGYVIGVASNFDGRLRGVLAGLSELPPGLKLVISSEVGWKKPARGFFERACGMVEMPPSGILFVGDDYDNDYLGATAAGMHALQLAPGGLEILADLVAAE